MKLLRETITNLMMENASILGTLPVEELRSRDLIIVVDMPAPEVEFEIYLCKEYDYDKEFEEVTDHIGWMNIESIGKRTMQVSQSSLDDGHHGKGFGALLYNVALASCTSQNIWLMSDRQEVSPQAQRVWDTWAKMPDKYEIHQTDHKQPDVDFWATEGEDYDPDVDFFLTKTRGDDFSQGSFQNTSGSWREYSDLDPRAQWEDMVKDWWYFFDDKYKKDFLASGLTKRFKMKDAEGFIKALEDNNLLYRI